MEATRRNLQARPKILKILSKHQINQSETRFSEKEFSLKSVKDTKGANRRSLQAQSKIFKKIIVTSNQLIRTKFSKKSMFVP
jgi:Skp family chaperone for outer membrane proteins